MVKTLTPPLNIEKIRADFPILSQKINGKPLVYFDNGATSQKPQQVINAITDYYTNYNSNIHRGVHHLSQKATDAYEKARETATRFINANSYREINFTKGTTEGINLVAQAWGEKFVKKGDEIIISAMEHHSNIVPWQMLCEKVGATLKVIPMNDNGELIMEEYERLLSEKTKMVAIVYVSNSLGTINPVKKIIELAHNVGAKVLLDAAQAVPHQKVDVQDLRCDFLTFSGHKMFGPTGTGILWGKESLLNEMNPYQGGGEMIKEVTFEKTTYNTLPYKFEAGTPNICGGIALAAAMEYMENVGIENIAHYENELLNYATNRLSEIEDLEIVGRAKNKASLVSFNIKNIHPYDMGVILDQMGIACRTGHHCCQPVMNRLNIEGTIRASFAFYNTKEEIDILVKGVERAKKMLS